MNETQVQAMLSSLQQQLSNACAGIAARDGTIALQAKEIEDLKAKLEQPQEAE